MRPEFLKMEILVANEKHLMYAEIICKTIEESAKVRGTGIAKRTVEYISEKIREQKAVIALEKNKFAGFCYIETWSDKKYVAHSGLIVHPDFRGLGLARTIKTFIFKYSQKKYPDAKIFGITTGLAVMKINSELGYRPVTFSELTQDEGFWNGCKACKNYEILKQNNRKMCLCTGMIHDGKKSKNKLWYKMKNLKNLKNKKIIKK